MEINFRKNIVASYLALIVQIIASLLLVRFAIHYFGVEKFGVFGLVTSIIGYLSSCDIGLPWAAATLFVKEASTQKRRALCQRVFKMLLCSSIIFITLVFFMNFIYPEWNSLLGNIPANLVSESKIFILVSVVGYFLYLPLSLFYQLLIFMHRSYFVKWLDAIKSVASLLVIVVIGTIGAIQWQLVSYAWLSSLILILLGLVCWFQFKRLQPVHTNEIVSCLEPEYKYKNLFTRSLGFFFSGLSGLVILNTDVLIISHFLNLTAVSTYVVISKFFLVGLQVVSQLMNFVNPLFPSLSQGKSKEYLSLITNGVVVALVLVGMFFMIVFGLFSKELVLIWIGSDSIALEQSTVFALCLYFFFMMLSMVPYSIIVSMGFAGFVARMTAVEAIVNLGLSIWFVQYWGMTGVIVASSVANGLITLVFSCWFVKKQLPNDFDLSNRNMVFYLVSMLLVSFVFVFMMMDSGLVERVISAVFGLLVTCLILWRMNREAFSRYSSHLNKFKF